MPTGLQVIGTHGVVQVDENWSNMVLMASGIGRARLAGQVPMLYNTTVDSNYEIDITHITNPLVSVKTNGNGFVMHQMLVVNGRRYVRFSAPSSFYFEYYIFGRGTASESNCGLQIFKADGSIAFDSAWRVLKIVSFAQTGNGANPPGSLSVASGNYAASLFSTSGHDLAFWDGVFSRVIKERWGVNTSATGCSTQLFLAEAYNIPWGGPPDHDYWNYDGGTLLLIDIG